MVQKIDPKTKIFRRSVTSEPRIPVYFIFYKIYKIISIKKTFESEYKGGKHG
jgi:hypothetical protein